MVTWSTQISASDGKYNTNMPFFFFFLRVPRSAHSKRDILTFTHQHINPE